MFSIRVSLLTTVIQQISQEMVEMICDRLKFSLSWDGTSHVLKVDGFETENEARKYLRSLEAGINWLLINNDVPIEANLNPQEIIYVEDPLKASDNFSQLFGASLGAPIDGFIDGSQAAVFESDKWLSAYSFNGGNPHTVTPSERVLESILEGTRFRTNQLENNPKLVVALKLYRAYYTESSTTARFLTLIIALEAMALPVPRSPEANSLLDKWSVELEGMINSYNDNEVVQDDLKSLRDEVVRRRESSIGTQISNLVKASLIGEADCLEQVKSAKRLYRVRCTLVHDGYVDPQLLGCSTSEAKSLVSRVIRARFLKALLAEETA